MKERYRRRQCLVLPGHCSTFWVGLCPIFHGVAGPDRRNAREIAWAHERSIFFFVALKRLRFKA